MKILLISFIASIFLAASCGSTKETSTTDQQTANNTASSVAAESAQSAASSSATNTSTSTGTTSSENQNMNQKPEEVQYRIIISLISIGEGTDAEAKKMMDDVVTRWETKIGKKLASENYPWGREGEVDFCFHLKELSPQDQAVFAREMREVLKTRQLVQISEFQACMHKR